MLELPIGAGYGILFGLITALMSISILIYKRIKIRTVDDFVAAGRSMPFGIIAASICVSWIWTTTIMGASEAGMWFGVGGGFNYGWGAAVPFFALAPLAFFIRTKMPRATTFTEFIQQRYGTTTHHLFYVFAIGIAIYVCMEQAVGAGYLFSMMFGIPFKLTAFVIPMAFTAYIAISGLRASIFNDMFQFLIVVIMFAVIVPIVVLTLGPHFIYTGLLDAATNPANPNYNPEALNFFAGAAWRYGIACVVIALGQIVLDQGYYQRAIAAGSTKTLKRAYILGGFGAWLPIPFTCGIVFGSSALALQLTPEVTTQISPYIMSYVTGISGALVFLVMVFMAAMTTGDTSMAGLQALLTVDLYKGILRPKATEKEQIRFGRLVIIPIGLAIAGLAMALEGVSLLYIDIVCGIFFAAPCGALLLGAFWKKPTEKIAIVSIVAGLIGGVAAWQLIADPDMNWFYGNMISFFVPIVIVVILSLIVGGKFDVSTLKEYKGLIKIGGEKK